MRIKFGELRIGDIARRNLQRVMDTDWASEGPLVAEFERKWSGHFGYAHSVSMSSGTDADINACLSLYDFGAVPGDEIICPALTFIATVNSIVLAGFTPRFADIDRNTLNIDPSHAESLVTPRTRAVMVTHTMGKPCEMDRIVPWARAKGLKVLEDCCEAHGALYKGTRVGKWGDVGMFSFYTAHLVVCGEGGMCSTDDPVMASLLRSTRSHGRKPGTIFFDHLRLGLNSKMNDLEAAVGLEGLENFDKTWNTRRGYKAQLNALLSDLEDVFILPKENPGELVSPHAYPLVFRDDNEERYWKFYKYLEDSGIQTKTLFASVPTQQKAYAKYGYVMGQFPEAEYVGRNGLHFGIHQYLVPADIEFISERIHAFVNEGNT